LDSSIDRSSVIPYYVQVRDTVQARIHAGVWRPGDQLPGEPELCRMFAVSRTVIRQALSDLVNQGFLIREKGKGTFVAQPKIRESLVQKLTGFHQDMVEQGHTPKAQVLRQESTPASQKVADYLQITPGTPVITIERLRFVQDIPIQLVTTYLPFALCPALLDVDLSDQSLYAFLEQTCGVFIARGHRSIEAVPANENEARLLRIQKGAPLILLDSVSFLSDGTAVEYYHALHRGDRTRFEVELIRVKEHGDRGEVLAPKYGNYPSGSGVILPPKRSDDK
jgi:GntR family transcriptional regulator